MSQSYSSYITMADELAREKKPT